MLNPYVYVSTGKARDVQRSAPTGARVAIHYPELGRTVELETDAQGRYVVTDRPAPGCSGETFLRARGDLGVSARLEYLRGQIRAECISYGEIAELEDLAEYIDRGDVELLEWAGVPEFPENGDSGEVPA